MARRFPMDVFLAEVTRVVPLSRDLVRVALAAPGLRGLAAPAGDGSGPVRDAYIKLLVPHPDHDGPLLPSLEDGWRQQWFAASAEERGGWMRTYTLRAARPWRSPEGEPGVEIEVDFVLHGEEGHLGPGAAWAAAARPGDRIGLIGPDREGSLWASWDAGEAATVLVAVDETAVPAAISCLESLPEGCRATLLMEVPPGNAEDLARACAPELAAARERAGVEVQWLSRSGEAGRGSALLAALRARLGLDQPAPERDRAELLAQQAAPEEIVWGLSDPASGTYVFLAGEAALVRQARRVCVGEAGIDKKDISFMGYWKAGHPES